MRKPSLVLVLASVLVAGVASGCSSAPEVETKPRVIHPRLDLQLSCDATDALVGQPVEVHAQVVNTGTLSTFVVHIGMTEGDGEPQASCVHVTDAAGRELEPRPQPPRCVWLQEVRLSPGAKLPIFGCDLSSVFDLTRPGTYKVQLRGVRPGRYLDPVDSNVLELTVK